MKNTIMLAMLVSVLVIASIAMVSANGNSEKVCGNNLLESGEQCDDGNLINGDGCSDKCKIEEINGNGGSGSIWTTTNLCGTEQQDVNKYNVNENVYINGDNFASGIYEWAIKGQPGGASCDPDEVIATGTYTVDSTGAFCFNAYTVKEGDCKEYKVSFDGKHDNYNVIPEFGTMVGILTALGAVGTFFIVRRK